jgi:hypothetical protein
MLRPKRGKPKSFAGIEVAVSEGEEQWLPYQFADYQEI